MSEHEEDDDNPWITALFGLFLIGVGVALYFYFGHLEQEGGSVRMNAIVLMIYKITGKTGLLVIFGGLGSLMTFAGIKGIVSGD